MVEKEKYQAGDKVLVKTSEEEYEGIVIESYEPEILILKQKSGYNIGINKEKIKSVKVVEKFKDKKEKIPELTQDKRNPRIMIMHTGGTIASKVDYTTGGVKSQISPSELLALFPELKEMANIDSKLLFQMFSEDMRPEHWIKIAKEVEKEIKKGVDGIIITHGTDTLHYTSAALSFMLKNLGIPVLLIGAQRSSDRGSSDAFLNVYCAVKFICESDFSGVDICMHSGSSDNSCYILQGTKARKLHASKRDAFKAVNCKPIAKVSRENIEFFRKDYIKKDKNRKSELDAVFNNNVTIIKIHPGITAKELEMYKDYDGLIIEGTGLGHLSVNRLDKETEENEKILVVLEKFVRKGMIIIIASQCIFGTTNNNVYSTGRKLKTIGTLEAKDLTAETAFVKLGWLLGHDWKKEFIKEKFSQNLIGEFNERISEEEFC
jgi:glutamyl-tRNA(Gln) amidotransferase subunit D